MGKTKLYARYIKGFGLVVVIALLFGTLLACAGPAGPSGQAGPVGPAGPPGKDGSEGVPGRSAGEGGTALSATVAGGKLIIAGSGFPPGKGIWLNIPGAAAEGRDVFLTTDLAIVNASGAFAVTLDMAKPPIGGKGGLTPGVYTIKSVGGDVVASAPLVIPAPPATPAPAKAATPGAATPTATPAATPAAATTPPSAAQGVSKLDVSYGPAPATGWKWGVGDITTGAEERTEETPEGHGFAWIFYVIRGSTEVGTADGKKVFSAGEAVMVPARQAHTHRYIPQSQLLVFRPADRPFGDFHRGNRLYESDAQLQLKAEQNYALRLREFTLAPKGSENITADGIFVYVVDGTVSVRAGDTVTTQQAGKVFALPSNVRHVLSNEGAASLKFILIDLHQ